MEIERRTEGLYLPELDLFLDPERPVTRAFVSHAHADHAAGLGSKTLFASAETHALLCARSDARPMEAITLGWTETLDIGRARLSIAPAGHVLGAAQLVIDHAGERFVYTGDYRSGGGKTHAVGAPVECDTLCIESTFALPIFSWPERSAEIERLIAFCRDALRQGQHAIVLAYALGKAEELCAHFLEAELPLALHGAVMKVAAAYESLGYDLGVASGRAMPYLEAKGRLPAVVLAPPNAAATITKTLKKARVAYVSGWATIDAHVDRYKADAGFVISDHADMGDLLATARASKASNIITTHGDAADLARLLVRAGLRARAIPTDAIDREVS